MTPRVLMSVSRPRGPGRPPLPLLPTPPSYLSPFCRGHTSPRVPGRPASSPTSSQALPTTLPWLTRNADFCSIKCLRIAGPSACFRLWGGPEPSTPKGSRRAWPASGAAGPVPKAGGAGGRLFCAVVPTQGGGRPPGRGVQEWRGAFHAEVTSLEPRAEPGPRKCQRGAPVRRWLGPSETPRGGRGQPGAVAGAMPRGSGGDR